MSFSASEIIEIAVQIERNGVSFYTRAAELTTDPDCRRLLGELAEMESDHQDFFQEMLAAVSRRPDPESIFGGDAEMLQYIRAMADGHVFDTGIDPGQILTGEETAEEILSTAIGLEKESIVYYAALKETVNDPRTQQELQDIIGEEMAHVAQLSGQREALR